MTASGIKRRKFQHMASSDANNDNDASFVSFSDQSDGDPQDFFLDAVEVGDMHEGGQKVDDDDWRDAYSSPVKEFRATRSTNASGTVLQRSHNSDVKFERANAHHKSTIFKLQLDELLERIRPQDNGAAAEAQAALHILRESIQRIPDTAPLSVDQAESDLMEKDVAIPFPNVRPPKDAKYKLAYASPININVVGSFASKTSPRSKQGVEVDMSLMMPPSLFEEKDFLDHRYFYKRAYYLACVASRLKAAHQSDYKFRFRLAHDDPLKAILVISPKETVGIVHTDSTRTSWRINIFPCVSHDLFSTDKLKPHRKNIRTFATSNDAFSECGRSKTMAFYNSSIRADMLMARFLKLIHNCKKTCRGFLDACLLGSTWLHQRGFGSSVGVGGFGSFEWTAMMALCLQGGSPAGPAGRPILSAGYTSYQLFKAMLQYVAVKDLSKSPVPNGVLEAPETTGKGLPVLWDFEGTHNLLYKMSPWSYGILRHEAKTTLTALSDQMHGRFDAPFTMQVQDLLLRYDHILEIPQAALFSGEHQYAMQDRLLQLHDVLSRGLGNRICQLDIIKPSCEVWEVDSHPPDHSQKGTVQLCLRVDQANVTRLVDHGPSADSRTEAAAFRKFWGDKAELRRFKDGSILESLVWSHASDTCSIPEQIIRLLLIRHFDITLAENTTSFDRRFESFITTRCRDDMADYQPLVGLYNQFENDLRNLNTLPLSIKQIAPADASLRYSSPLSPPVGQPVAKLMHSNVVMQFESSVRWPDDLVAIQRTKIAFLLKIKEALDKSVDLATCRIGLENEDQDLLNQAFLEVAYKADATFRLRIHHDRERTLLEQQLKETLIDPKRKELTAIGLAKYKRDYMISPLHTQAIAELCRRYPVLSGSVRLTKQWFASHMLLEHIAEEVIELFVVRTFNHPWPWQMPSSVQTGFLQTLSWLSRWDWRAEPLMVNLRYGTALKQPTARAITTRFEAWRKLDPAFHRITFFVASELDHAGNTWTDGSPSVVVASRMTSLTRAACAAVSSKQLQLEPTSLFSSPVMDFDFAININPRFYGVAGDVSRRSTFKNLELASTGEDQLGYKSTQQFYTALSTAFTPVIFFFYGGHGCRVIVGLWNPQTTHRSWKVNLAYSTLPFASGSSKESQASVNKSAILSEIARLGGDIVQNIKVFRH